MPMSHQPPHLHARLPAPPCPPRLHSPQPTRGAGATLLKGSLEDYPSLREAVRQVDVVICAVPTKHELKQKAVIQAIKEVGCVKRFIPAEFGLDPTKVQIGDMDHGFYEKKAEIHRLIQ